MTILPQRRLGKSGLTASNLGFGCMRLPLVPGGTIEDIDVPEAMRMIRHAIDSGVNYVDTAWPYHAAEFPKPGKSEPVVGQALTDGYRERVTLVTKLPLWCVETRADMDLRLDEQLKRLGVSYLDVYLAHNLNTTNWAKAQSLGLTDFMDAAVKDGRIRHPAFSFHDRFPLFQEILESYDWHIAQIQYNYLDIDYQAGRRGLHLAARRDVGVVIMEPLRGGLLINGIPDDLRQMLAEVRPTWSMADWGLRWLWSQPEVGVVLSGMSAMPQVKENLRIAAAEPAWTPQDEAALAMVRKRFEERIKVGCTGCGYCLPCPNGVNIPKCFLFYNEYFMADDNAVRARARVFYERMTTREEKADNCIACGECLSKCPQGIPIAEALADVAQQLR